MNESYSQVGLRASTLDVEKKKADEHPNGDFAVAKKTVKKAAKKVAKKAAKKVAKKAPVKKAAKKVAKKAAKKVAKKVAKKDDCCCGCK